MPNKQQENIIKIYFRKLVARMFLKNYKILIYWKFLIYSNSKSKHILELLSTGVFQISDKSEDK